MAHTFSLRDINGIILGDVALPVMSLAIESFVPPPPLSTSEKNDAESTLPRGVSSMIRKSITISKSKAVSPPLSISPGSSSPVSPSSSSEQSRNQAKQLECAQVLVASTSNLEITPQMRRVAVEDAFPSCTFGRHTSLKMTPYRCRHFAVSRFHFTIAFVPNRVVDHLREVFVEHEPQQQPREKKKAAKKSARSANRDSVSSTSVVRSPYTDQSIDGSFCLFNWSVNPLYVNSDSVPSLGRGMHVLREGDVVSLLVNPFDPVDGILTREPHTGKVVLRKDAAAAVPPRLESSPPKTMLEAMSLEYDPFDSPIRKGTSFRHPSPLPVFIVTRREPSPEVSINLRRRSTSAKPEEPEPPVKKSRKRL